MSNGRPMARRGSSPTVSCGQSLSWRLLVGAATVLVTLLGGCGSADRVTVNPPPDLTPGVMDVTFFVTSDTHFKNEGCPNPDRAAIQAMNTKVIGQPNPAEPGHTIQTPSCVLTLGDLADGGDLIPATDTPDLFDTANYQEQWNGFNTHFPLNGVPGDINRLAFPNCATVGNHDRYRLFGTMDTGESLYVATAASQRQGATVDPNTGNVYYSFDVDGVHVVLLGRWADDTVCAWLRDDLQAVGTQVPVVIGLHYSFNDGQLWWTDAERQKLADVIAGYRIVALLNGHTHHAQIYQWQGYDCFDDGSAGKNGEFAVMRLTATSLSWAQYKATWDDAGNWTGGAWTGTFSKAL
jgi:hypothetical protein